MKNVQVEASGEVVSVDIPDPTSWSPTDRDALSELIGRKCARLNELGVSYWLDRGTLLGAARDGRVIPYDGDGDFALMENDYQKLAEMASTQTLFPGLHVKLRKAPANKSITYMTVTSDASRMHSDIAMLSKVRSNDGEVMLHDPYGFSHETHTATKWGTLHRRLLNLPLSAVLPLQSCTLGVQECKCPNDVDAYLSAIYGNDWYVPKPYYKGTGDRQMSDYIGRILSSSAFLSVAMRTELENLEHGIAHSLVGLGAGSLTTGGSSPEPRATGPPGLPPQSQEPAWQATAAEVSAGGESRLHRVVRRELAPQSLQQEEDNEEETGGSLEESGAVEDWEEETASSAPLGPP